jgi:hypothetical protein
MLIICDIPALKLHAELGAKLKPLPQEGAVLPTLTAQDLALVDSAAFERRYGTIHVIAGSREERDTCTSAIPHLCSSEIPANSVCMVKQGVGVASVALTTVLMSRTLTDYQLIRLLYEECATYRVYDYRNTYKPLSNVKSLKEELKRLLHIRGSVHVLQLLEFVVDNSASPRETDLAMLAWLPWRLGGYGFPIGEMNKKKHFGDAVRRCDIWFEKAKLGIEYESDESHSGEADIAHDSARRTFLGNKGCTVITMTNGEFKDDALSHETMRYVGKLLGRRVREPRGRSIIARKELLAFVRSPHSVFF